MTGPVLRIDASARSGDSLSRRAGDAVLDELAPSRVIHRDLAAEPLPQVDAAWVAARSVPADRRTAAEAAAMALSDRLIGEIAEADTLVITLPIYNFGVPAALKAWIDLVAVPRVSFRYTEGGPVGLMTGKRAIVVVASGGTRTGSPIDFATPFLRHVLRFIGITDVEIRRAADVLDQGRKAA